MSSSFLSPAGMTVLGGVGIGSIFIIMLFCLYCCQHPIRETNKLWTGLDSNETLSLRRSEAKFFEYSDGDRVINPLPLVPVRDLSFDNQLTDDEDEIFEHEIIDVPSSSYATTQV